MPSPESAPHEFPTRSGTGPPDALIVNDTIFNLTLALSGLGIAYIFKQLAQPYLDDGLLQIVLPKAAMQEPPLCLYFPRYANEQPKLRALIDTFREVQRPRSKYHRKRTHSAE